MCNRRLIQWACGLIVAVTTEASAAEYSLGADSSPRDGVPRGTVIERTYDASRIYPGTSTAYSIYVPAQYDAAHPACVMIFQDGEAYVHPEGQVRAATVFDNLIHVGEIPACIGIFVNPASKDAAGDQRPAQYVPTNDTYARFLLEEMLPEVGKDYNLTADRENRAIGGMSDGGLVSFTVAWERPDAFSKVISHIGSYTRLRGGSEYPYLIRKTRGNPKPIRVFLQDGENDVNLHEGNWTLANLMMESALGYARWDYRFELGSGGHDLGHAGAIFPDTLRWLWRDHPDVSNRFSSTDVASVTGVWDVVANFMGFEWRPVLTIDVANGGLVGSLDDADEGTIPIDSIQFDDGILSFEYAAPASQAIWFKNAPGPMTTWLQLEAGIFRGALSKGIEAEIDYPISGTKRSNDRQ